MVIIRRPARRRVFRFINQYISKVKIWNEYRNTRILYIKLQNECKVCELESISIGCFKRQFLLQNNSAHPLSTKAKQNLLHNKTGCKNVYSL